MMDNVGYAYERRIISVNDVLAKVGGTYTVLFSAGAVAYLMLGQPFKLLDFAISFRKLQENQAPELFCREAKYEMERHHSRIGTSFYFRYWCAKRVPIFFDMCFRWEEEIQLDEKSRPDDPTFFE